MLKLALAVCLTTVVTTIVLGQEKPATFEVASVKANKSGDSNGNLRMLPGGRVNATNMPVRPIITFAYQIAQYQLVGGPAWLATDRYDLVAKMEGDSNPSPTFVPGANTPNPMQLALRSLLEERFKLKAHRETREMDIYALVMAKPGGGPGPGLKPTTQDCAAAAAAARQGGPPPTGAPFCGIQGNPGRIKFGGLPAASFAAAFSGPSGRMVVDRTGLTGAYDFDLEFTPDAGGRAGAPAPDSATAVTDRPSLFTALEEQLGLKLQPVRAPIDVIVIDRVTPPTDN